jgi:hypothetical protein
LRDAVDLDPTTVDKLLTTTRAVRKRLDLSRPVPRDVNGSIFPEMWSFQLALRSRGLGTTSVFVTSELLVSEVVGAPTGSHLAGLLPVAYYTGSTFTPARRCPVEDVTSFDRWATAAP